MKIYTTAPLEDPRQARTIYPELEHIGCASAPVSPSRSRAIR